MISFSVEQKQVEVYPSEAPHRPVIYLNSFSSQITPIRDALKQIACPDFSLVAVYELAWDHDMAPWDIPPISKDDTPCTGGADDYLTLLLGNILPEAEKSLMGVPSWRGIAGYSLAGLFAVYALTRTDVFSCAASMSGSLWYPGLTDYLSSHAWKRTPDKLYFSLGDREDETSNPFLRPVRRNTESIFASCRAQHIDTIFNLNPGNHYQDAPMRTAKGIAWLLEEEK